MTRKHNIGFTLVELMVAMVLAIIILGSLYMIYTSSMAAYRVEDQILSMQERLRFGLEHVKRDLRRAGFLATPNSRAINSNVCYAPVELRGVMLQLRHGDNPYPLRNPNLTPASITLFGDFFSGHTYRTIAVQADKVFLLDNNDPVTGGGSFPRTESDFLRIFARNRFLRIVTKEQSEIYIPITSSNFVEKSITLATPVPVSGAGGCGVSGFGDGLDVNVAGFIRYSIMSDVRPNAPVGKTDLVREELQTDGLTEVANSALVIADYAVDLQFYDFGFENTATGSVWDILRRHMPNEVAGTGTGWLDNHSAAVPHLLRYLTVKLTVRSEDEDPKYNFNVRASEFQPLDGYDLSEMEGACRTLSMASRVFLTSISMRNLNR